MMFEVIVASTTYETGTLHVFFILPLKQMISTYIFYHFLNRMFLITESFFDMLTISTFYLIYYITGRDQFCPVFI